MSLLSKLSFKKITDKLSFLKNSVTKLFLHVTVAGKDNNDNHALTDLNAILNYSISFSRILVKNIVGFCKKNVLLQ